MKRKDQGETLMNEVFGKEISQVIDQQLNKISPPFLDFLKETFSDIYGDTTLDLKTKEIIVITTLITQKDTKNQLKAHIRAALKAGITRKEVLALIRHLVIYVGFPGAMNALYLAQEVFDEADGSSTE